MAKGWSCWNRSATTTPVRRLPARPDRRGVEAGLDVGETGLEPGARGVRRAPVEVLGEEPRHSGSSCRGRLAPGGTYPGPGRGDRARGHAPGRSRSTPRIGRPGSRRGPVVGRPIPAESVLLGAAAVNRAETLRALIPIHRRGSGSQSGDRWPTQGSRTRSVSASVIRSASVCPAALDEATPEPKYPPPHASPVVRSSPTLGRMSRGTPRMPPQ